MDFYHWLKLNLMSKHNIGSGLPWYLVFMFICWYIWKWRNQRVFYVDFELPATPKTPILLAVREWHGAVQEALKSKLKTQVMLTWIPPETGHYKLNVDGTRITASGAIGVGDLIRDCTGDWIRGFAVNLGEGQILDAEIWALYFGLKLAMDLGLNNLLIEMDSATAVNLLHKPNLLDYHPLAALIGSCNELIAQIGGCFIHHIYRERNYAADAIANWSYNLALGGCLLDEAPSWLENILLDDILGIATPRMIPAAA